MRILKVENIYNTLFKFEASKKQKLYPIHKKLRFKRNADFKNFNDISDWIITYIKLNESAKIFDAGCGVGYVLLKLCKHYCCKGIGVSLSDKEIEAAKTNSKNQQLNENCTFKVQNFDEVDNETFDLIIAIESIKHSSNIKHTLKRFQKYLKEEGHILIVEDYLNPAYKNHALAVEFSNAWNVPLVYTEQEFQNYCNQNQLACVESINLTTLINKKNAFLSQLKLFMLQIYRLIIRNPERKTQLNIYRGALIMDYFYAKGIFEYKLKVLKK